MLTTYMYEIFMDKNFMDASKATKSTKILVSAYMVPRVYWLSDLINSAHSFKINAAIINLNLKWYSHAVMIHRCWQILWHN